MMYIEFLVSVAEAPLPRVVSLGSMSAGLWDTSYWVIDDEDTKV